MDTTQNETTKPATTQGAKDATTQGASEGKNEDAMSSSPAYEGTPGAIYVDTYLFGIDRISDGSWIVEAINESELHACSRCHFLSLPQRPFPLDELQIRNAEAGGFALTADACDVCAFLPTASLMLFAPADLSRGLDRAGEVLAEARMARAVTLFRLYMEQETGAEALLWAMMANAREDARRLGTTPQGE